MSYSAIVHMASSMSLLQRVAASAAANSVNQPMQWAQDNIWAIAASPAWDVDWDYAEDVSAQNANVNPDLGVRTDVIDDARIDAAVQARIAELAAPPA